MVSVAGGRSHVRESGRARVLAGPTALRIQLDGNVDHTCQPCNTVFLDHPPKFSLIFCDFPGSRKNARFFNRFWAHVQSIVVALTTPPPALELISHDLRPLPRPDLTALQRCTTKNPRTTRHSGMKRGIFPQNPGSWEVGLNSGKIGGIRDDGLNSGIIRDTWQVW